MVRGATRHTDEPMSLQAKIVFGIVIFLGALTLIFAFQSTSNSDETNESLTRADCRSEFAARVADANAALNGADAKTRRGQILAQYYGGVDNQVLFQEAVDVGFEGLHEQYNANHKVDWYNKEYQKLIQAQINDMGKFKKMCEDGPEPAPKPPRYDDPPR